MILGRGHHILTSILPLPQVIGAEDPPHPCPGQGIRPSRQFRAQHGPPTPQLSPGLRELPGSGSHPGHPPHGARGPWARWCLHTPQGARAPVLVPWVYEASMEEGHRPQVLVPEASHALQNVETRPHARVPRSPLRSPWQRAGNERRLSRLLAGCGENPRVAPGRRHSPTLGEAPAGHWPRLCGRVSTGQGRANESHVPGGRFPWDLGPRATEAPTRGPGHTSGCAGLRPRQPGTPRCTRAPGPQAAPSFAQSASHRGRPSGPESPHDRVIAILGERGDKPQEPLSQGPSD